MALPSSGPLSLNDMHVEVNGTSGTTCSINDSDIRGLIDKADGAQSSFNEFYGAANVSYISASGGSTTTSGNYKYHYFNSSGTFTINSAGVGGSQYTTVDYIIIAGGGAGGTGGNSGPSLGTGGSGGGGTGANCPSTDPATAATANTGGGGGGGAGNDTASAGGSGVVILRYKYQN